MNSLDLYYILRQKYLSEDSIWNSYKLIDVDTIISRIYNEIFRFPFSLKKSPFVYAMINMIKRKNSYNESSVNKVTANGIFVTDAYVIMQGLVEYISNFSFTATNCFQKYEKYLFNSEMSEKEQMRQMQEINCKLWEIKNRISERRREFSLNRKNVVADEVYQQMFRRNEVRMEQNRNNIQLWHNKQDEISAKLIKMQPSVSQLLENFMSFSDNITNQYVLQFAKMQIELFDFISEVYVYHKKKIKLSENQDYVNSVLNYKDFMDSICDGLAVFGIEEICSEPGTCFDGMIHEPDINLFSSKTALIEESIRTGFKYKDIIIQKEKIKIKE